MNRRAATGERADPFPELTAAMQPALDKLDALESHFADQEQAAVDGGNLTAGAAYGRLQLSAAVERIGIDRELAEHRRVAALEERRAWSKRPPSDEPGIGAPPAEDVEVH